MDKENEVSKINYLLYLSLIRHMGKETKLKLFTLIKLFKFRQAIADCSVKCGQQY